MNFVKLILISKLAETTTFKMANFYPRHCTVSTCLIVCFLWPLAVGSSPLEVDEGLYSRVTVQIEAQPQPENCVEFLNQLEVGTSKMKFFLHTAKNNICFFRKKNVFLFYRQGAIIRTNCESLFFTRILSLEMFFETKMRI